MPTRSSSFVLLVCAGLLWGTGGITGHALADSSGLSAAAIGGYRLALGGFILVSVQLVRRRPLPRNRSQWARILTVAGLAAVFQSAYFAAVATGSVSSATLITIGSAPIFVVAGRGGAKSPTPDPQRQPASRARGARTGPADRRSGRRHESRRQRGDGRAGRSIGSGFRRIHHARPTAFGRPRRAERGRVRLPRGRLDSAGRDRSVRLAGVQSNGSQPRLVAAVRDRADGAGLHVVLPRAARFDRCDRDGGGPARTTDRDGAGDHLVRRPADGARRVRRDHLARVRPRCRTHAAQIAGADSVPFSSGARPVRVGRWGLGDRGRPSRSCASAGDRSRRGRRPASTTTCGWPDGTS